jgi:hypothetical protein
MQDSKLDIEKAAPAIEETATASDVRGLKVWSDPVVTELEISRTSNNPSVGSDGGTGDCQHL